MNIPEDDPKSNPFSPRPPRREKLRAPFSFLYVALRQAARTVVEGVRRENENLLERHAALDPLLSIEDVAETLGKSKRWCETALAKEELPPPLWIGGTRRWHPDSIDAYIRQQAGRTER